MASTRKLRNPRRTLHGLACTVLVAGSLSSRAYAADAEPVPPCPAPPSDAQRPLTNNVRLVTGVPYSAMGTSETITTLPDGNRIVRLNRVRMWRDSDGRTRAEYSLSSIGGPLPLEVNSTVTIIDDPATRTRYMLQPAAKVAVAVPITPCRAGDPPRSTPPQNIRPLNLGERELDGEKVFGSRIESTIPAGAIGNEQPITMSAEQWYGQDLKVVVEATYVDPRTGETRYRLRNIKRQEPDARLFRVPKDYSKKPANSGTGTVSGGGFNRR